jgi:hypothetical protein
MTRRGLANITHGFCRNGTGGPEYRALAGIKERCSNPKIKNFHRYGGRGIKVCDRWLHGEGNLSGIECFVADLGRKPSPAHSVERMDNDGHYEPGNCRWATPQEQSNNTRRNKTIEINGRTLTIAQAAREFGIPYARLWARIFRLNINPEIAVKEDRYGI